MELVLLRHGRAEERGLFDGPDEMRPLTRDGIKRLHAALPGLARLLPRIDLVVSSPLLRARQTAEEMVVHYQVPLLEHAALVPGGEVEAFNRWLVPRREQVVMAVGHEPDLGRFASWYLSGREESFVALRKGGLCLLHFPVRPAAAKGELQLLLTNAQLRRLA